MLNIQTKTGSATSPKPENGRPVIIGHCCNSAGGWGAGFVLAVSRLSKAPEYAYKAWAKENKLQLGNTQFVEAEPDVIIANMIAQDRYAKNHSDGVAVDYVALEKCLETTLRRAMQLNADVHFPDLIGAGLAGGDKNKIHAIIKKVANSVESNNPGNLDITFWDFPG